jgi:hypothetical protein
VLALAALGLSCGDDPVAPAPAALIEVLGVPAESVLTGAPARALGAPVRIRVTDAEGRPLQGVPVEWTAVGVNARVKTADAETDAEGQAAASWVLGWDAPNPQILLVKAGQARTAVRARAVPDEVAALQYTQPVWSVRLGVPESLRVEAVDPYGNVFAPAAVSFQSLDTSRAVVDAIGRILGRRRGAATVIAISGRGVDTAVVAVRQVVASIVVAPESVIATALGQECAVRVELRDDIGQVVADSQPTATSLDTLVAVVGPAPAGVLVRSRANGRTAVRLAVADLERAVPVSVGQVAASVTVVPESLAFDAVGDLVTLAITVRDSLGADAPTLPFALASSDTAVVAVTVAGAVRSRADGTAIIRVASGPAADSIVARVAQRVTRVATDRDSLRLEALGAVVRIGVRAEDRLGAVVPSATLTAASSDTAIATVTPDGTVRAVANGTATVTFAAAAESVAVVVRVAQRPVRWLAAADTLRFVALGETQSLAVVAVDSLGHRVPGVPRLTAVGDTALLAVADSVTVRARGNGSTEVSFEVAGLTGRIPVVVTQVAESLVVTPHWNTAILSLPLDSGLPLTCTAYDRNGAVVATPPVVAPSGGARWTGATCADLRLQRSGFDTLLVSAGRFQTAIPVVLTVRPLVTPAGGEPLVLDSLPALTGPWAPTLHPRSPDTLELYVAAYSLVVFDSDGNGLGDLHRLISTDGGATFRYDTLILRRDSLQCSLAGNGIENIAIVPRADGGGLRLFFAAGSYSCYGWQVFSATSTDGRRWTWEPGVRVSNGGTLPPAPPVTAPWPTGEGMVVEFLALTSEWRMLVGGYENVSPPLNKFEIVEFRSTDQLTWRYAGPLLTTRQLPPELQRSVYSPTVREVVPGLWRMLFTGDDLNVGGRSRLWSAVSTDGANWQFEGEVLGMPGRNYFYSTLVGDRLVTVLGSGIATRRLYTATVQMP